MSGVNVRVVARFRPADKKQLEMQSAYASKQGKKTSETTLKKNSDSPFSIEFSGGAGTVTVVAPPDENKNLKEGGIGLAGSGDRSVKHNFSFDDVLSPECTQEDVYAAVAQGGVDDILKGYNCTVFAYGQTGSGKSHSMFGPKGHPELAGIIPRAASGMFAGISASTDIQEVKIKCMFLEIYRETVRDLLNPAGGTKLKVREKNGDVVIEGLREESVASADDILKVVQLGEKSRSVTATDMNEVSSRSHSLLIVILTQNMKDGTQRVSRLNLVDLAGSERIAKTHATGQTLEEAKMINQSLSSLGNCITALTTPGRSHIPFRDSMLTYLLKDSLGGNTKTTLLVCCSSEAFNCDETVSTLLFAKRVKKIKNKATINSQLSNAQLVTLVGSLKKKLSMANVTIQMIRDFMSGKLDPTDAVCVEMLQTLLAGNPGDEDDEDILEGRLSQQDESSRRGSYQDESSRRGSYQIDSPRRGSYQDESPRRGSYQDESPRARRSYQDESPRRGSSQDEPLRRGSYQDEPLLRRPSQQAEPLRRPSQQAATESKKPAVDLELKTGQETKIALLETKIALLETKIGGSMATEMKMNNASSNSNFGDVATNATSATPPTLIFSGVFSPSMMEPSILVEPTLVYG